jgi:hypothetical protein
MPPACDRFSIATLAPGRRINREGLLAESVNNHGAFAWSIAELLRGDYKQSEYQKVILPLVVIRRLDAVLEPTKDAVRAKYEQYKDKVDNVGPILEQVSGEQFSNVSQLTFRKLLDDPSTIADNLRSYIAGFSGSARDVIDKFELDTQIARLDKADLLYMVIARFADLDLHPDEVSNEEMGYLYEDLIRKFSELSNETAGEHFTPRDVIELMVNLLFIEDDDVLSKPGVVRTVYDPAAGTGHAIERICGPGGSRRNPEHDLKCECREVRFDALAHFDPAHPAQDCGLSRSGDGADRCADRQEAPPHRPPRRETHRHHHQRRHEGPQPCRPHEGIRHPLGRRGPSALENRPPWLPAQEDRQRQNTEGRSGDLC